MASVGSAIGSGAASADGPAPDSASMAVFGDVDSMGDVTLTPCANAVPGRSGGAAGGGASLVDTRADRSGSTTVKAGEDVVGRRTGAYASMLVSFLLALTVSAFASFAVSACSAQSVACGSSSG